MNIPREIELFVEKTNTFQGIGWVEILGEIKGQPCTRLFGYCHTKTYGIEIKEVAREFIDHNEISGSLYFNQMAGYRIAFPRKSKTSAYYKSMEEDNKFYPNEEGNFWYPKVTKSILYTAKEACELLYGFIPYFSLSNMTDIYSLMEYARAYMKYPQLEYLAKAGFPYLYKDKRLFRLSAPKMKSVARWINENKDYMYSHMPTYSFIMMALRNKEDAWATYYRCKAMNDMKYLKDYEIIRTYEEMVEIAKYLEKQGCDIVTYKDYLVASKTLNRNMTDRGVLFPRNLMEQHDHVTEMASQKANKSVNRKLKKIYKTLESYGFKYKGLQIVIPKTQAELVRWGNALHNCVGTMGYGKKMAGGKCIILGVFKDGKPVECCELQPASETSTKMKIEQLRGDHNQDSEFHNIAEKLINKFISAYSSPVVGACA